MLEVREHSMIKNDSVKLVFLLKYQQIATLIVIMLNIAVRNM